MKFKIAVLGLLLMTQITAFASSEEVASDSTKDKVEQKTLGEYLLVVKSFSTEMQALNYFNQLCNNDVDAHFYYDLPNNRYMVHLGRYYFLEDAKLVLSQNPYPQLRKSIVRVKAYPQE